MPETCFILNCLPRLPNLRVISNYGVGVDHIDVRAATRKRLIPVGNTPDVLNGAVADQAMALLLAAGQWSQFYIIQV